MAPTALMINGLPGNMTACVVRHALADARFRVVPFSLTGPEISATETSIDEFRVALIHPDRRQAEIQPVIAAFGPFISVDFTHPAAVNGNAEFYCGHGLPFVMGTTGGDRDRLQATVAAAGLAAVIAPNMGKQIVGFQAMMAWAAETFAGLFSGYRLSVRESHQQGKADTSGTARAMLRYFSALGAPLADEEIQMERDPAFQKAQWGIPEAYLKGHGWHTYTLDSADGTVRFEFTHNVNGRDIYALGTLDAADFLAAKIEQGQPARIYSMIDVLKGL
ncbi:MAG: dihydrodipicolinate reductase [Desulfobacterales bacterium]